MLLVESIMMMMMMMCLCCYCFLAWLQKKQLVQQLLNLTLKKKRWLLIHQFVEEELTLQLLLLLLPMMTKLQLLISLRYLVEGG